MNWLIAMAPAGGENGGGNFMGTIMMFGAIFLIFYFMIIRPQKKKQKERDSLLKSLKKGDKVVTSGGMHGTISGLDETSCLIDVGNNVKIKFDRGAVTNIHRNKETKD